MTDAMIPRSDLYPTINFDGVEYLMMRQLQFTHDLDGLKITTTPAEMEPVNACDKCHRSDWRERIAFSIDEAVKYGWLRHR